MTKPYLKTLRLCVRNAEYEYSYNKQHCPQENTSTQFGIPEFRGALPHERQFNRYLDECPELAKRLHMITIKTYKRIIRNVYREHGQPSNDMAIETMYGKGYIYKIRGQAYQIHYNKQHRISTVSPLYPAVNLPQLLDCLHKLTKGSDYIQYTKSHRATTVRMRGYIRHLWQVISQQSEGMSESQWQMFKRTLSKAAINCAKQARKQR